jgi:hypothetical protein
LTGLAVDLDTVMQKLFKVGTIEYAIASRLRIVDDEFVLDDGSFSGGGLGLRCREKRKVSRCEPTEKLTQQSSTGH